MCHASEEERCQRKSRQRGGGGREGETQQAEPTGDQQERLITRTEAANEATMCQNERKKEDIN